MTRTKLVGREADLARVQEGLATARVVTLHGPPGVGKSRLLRSVASPLDLAGVVDAAGLLARIAASLGVTVADPLAGIVAELGERAHLLALDPFEHLVGAADVVADLVDAAPRLQVLIASRERTRIAGEVIVPVDPLPLEDAVALFLERARAVAPQRALTRDDVVALVERLDRLPLAIEIAAARTPILSPRELLARMHEGVLREAIETSFALLADDERQAWTALSVFRGGFTLAAAEGVLGAHAPALLDALVAHALVAVSPGDETRFFLLETLREEAARRLDDRDAVARHARYYTGWVASASPEQIARERDNLLAALEHVDATDTVRLVVALDPLLINEGPAKLHRELLDRALAVESACTLPGLRALLWRAHGRYHGLRGRHREALAIHGRARELFAEAGDAHGGGWTAAMMSFSARALRDPSARALAEASARSVVGNPPLEAMAEMTLGLAETDRAAGYARLRHAAAIARAAHAPRMMALSLANAAAAARDLGKLDDARALVDEARATFEQISDRFHLAKIAPIEGKLLRLTGAFDRAEALLVSAIDALTRFGNPEGEAEARLELAALALDRGDRRMAERALDDARATLGGVDNAELLAVAHELAARIEGTVVQARALRVAPDGRAFTYGERRVELGRSGVSRRVLLAFVQHRLANPGVGLSVHDVFAAGWPGQRAVGNSGHARVYMTIRALRAMGLETALLTHDDGYLLDPRLDVALGEI